jgi:hypothetical protein
MKMSIALAVAAFALVGASSARADLTFTDPTITDQGGGLFFYGGSFINNTASDIYVDGFSLTGFAGLNPTSIEGDLTFTDLPKNFAPGESFGTNDFFELTVPSGFTGPIVGLFTLNSGADVVGQINVGAAVPEPGAMALMGGTLVSGGLLLMRRRRK